MPRTNETNHQKETYLQAGQYLLEQFSMPALRSHATVAVVDRNRIQFYHATHSVILVTSAIAFLTFDDEDGLNKFIAIVMAFNRLSLEDNGILHELPNGPHFKDNEKVMTRAVDRKDTKALRIQEGNQLEFLGRRKTQNFTLTFGKLISREPSLAGRSTVVFHAVTKRWSKLDLVAKISWPGAKRVAENEFLRKATSEAKGTHRWALNHLPRTLYFQDVVFKNDSVFENVVELFDSEDLELVNGGFNYEERVLRIIIQERLYPLSTLTDAREVAQVLVDIMCSVYFHLIPSHSTLTPVCLVYWWLYEHVGILHRDLSINNIMCRWMRGKVYGVLVDYDLASWKDDLGKNYKKTSEQRTGTPPFMAHGLLDGSDPLHLYRHDLEALFYVMLILATRYEVGTGGVNRRLPEEGQTLNFQGWFDAAEYEKLGAMKSNFFTKVQDFDVSPSFQDFYDWLERLQASFTSGFQAKGPYELQKKRRRLFPTRKATFDDETLGGHVTYSAFIESTRELTGKLEGIIIRGSPPTGATGAQAEVTVGRNTRNQRGRGGRRGGSGKRKN